MTDTKLQKALDFLKMANDGLTKEEFLTSFKAVLSQVAIVEARLVENINKRLEGIDKEVAVATDSVNQSKIAAELEIQHVKESVIQAKNELQQIVKETRDANNTTLASLKTRALESIDTLFTKMRVNAHFDQMMQECTDKMDQMDAQMSAMPDTKRLVQDVLAQIPPDTEETAIETRDKLESLEGDERLDKSAVKGIDELEAKIKNIEARPVGRGGQRQRIHIADCSSQCDGANKTFTVGGSHMGIISVSGTQFPLIYRPVIDFTETVTGFLLTAEVGAPATGQTLIVQYQK